MAGGWVADYSVARPGATALKAAGATGAMRYIAPGRNDGAQITAVEIADFNAQGLPYGLVMEFGADWILGGYNSGLSLAQAALAEETQLGIPRGVTYAACDFDIQPSQFGQALDTLHGLADGYGGMQYVGVYGSKSFCEWVGANSTITHFWSTDAWSNYVPATNAALHQHAGWPAGVPVVPGCDHNLILGDWAPRTGEVDLTPEEHNVLYTTAKAVVQLGGVLTQLQTAVAKLATDEATRAQLIMHGDATHNSLDSLTKAIKGITPGTADPGLMNAVNAVGAKIDGLKLGVVA